MTIFPSGAGEQTTKVSWFPPPQSWEGSSYDSLEWTPKAEQVFQSVFVRFRVLGAPKVKTLYRNTVNCLEPHLMQYFDYFFCQKFSKSGLGNEQSPKRTLTEAKATEPKNSRVHRTEELFCFGICNSTSIWVRSRKDC